MAFSASSSFQLGTKEICKLYIDAAVKLNLDLSNHVALKRAVLTRAYLEVDESGNMSEEHYTKYIEYLFCKNPRSADITKVNSRNEQIIVIPNGFLFQYSSFQVIEKSLGIYPESIKLWTLNMRYKIFLNKFEHVRDAFHVAKDVLGPVGPSIWHLYFLYLKTKSSDDIKTETDRLIDELSQITNTAFDKVKSAIIGMQATMHSTKRARITYELFNKHHPIKNIQFDLR